jgi:hypothetical protein
MAIIQISKIQVRTGNVSDLPQLSPGEFGWADDERRLFIGNDANRVGDPDPNNTEILTKYSPIDLSGNVTISNVANFSLGGGNNGYFLQTNGNGVLTWSAVPNAVAGTVAGSTNQIQYNNAGALNASANLNFYSSNSALVVTGSTVTSNLSVTDTATMGNANITNAYFSGNANISNGQIFATRITVDQANVNANIVSNTIVANLVLRAATTLEVNDGSGSNTAGNLIVGNYNVWANSTGIALTGNLTAQGFVSAANANFSSNANVGNATVNVFISEGNVVATRNVTASNLTIANSTTVNTIAVTNVVSNLIPNANVTYNLGNNTNRWKDIYLSNSSIFLGDAVLTANANDLAISNANLSVNGNVSGNSLSLSGALTANGNVTFGNVAISNGNVTVTRITAGNANLTTITNDTITSNTANIAANLTIGGNLNGVNANFSGNIVAHTISGNFNTSSVVNGNSNIVIQPNSTITFTSNGQPDIIVISSDGFTATTAIANSVTVTQNITAANFIGNLSNGNSRIQLTSNSNIAFISAGNTVANITGTGVNVAGTGNFSGNLSAPNIVGLYANGNSNISIPAINGTIFFSVGGTANVLQVGNLGIATNVDLTVNNTVNATNVFSNVVNANAIVGPLVTASQPNITSIGNLVSLTVNTNANIGANLTANVVIASNGLSGQLITANQPNVTAIGQLSNLVVGNTGTTSFYSNGSFLSTGNGLISSNLTVGSFLTATLSANSNAQPNITSVGTLTNLAIGGTLTVNNLSNVSNISANVISANYANIGNITSPNLSSDFGIFDRTVTTSAVEHANIFLLAPIGTLIFNAASSTNYLFQSGGNANFTINITNLSNVMPIGTTMELSAVVKNPNTAISVANVIQIDGSNANISWVSGAPTPVANGYDVYTFNVFSTAASTFFVIGKRQTTS